MILGKAIAFFNYFPVKLCPCFPIPGVILPDMERSDVIGAFTVVSICLAFRGLIL